MERAYYFAPINLKSIFKKSEKVSRLADMSAIAYTFEHSGYPLATYFLPEDLQLEMQELNGAKLEVKLSGLKTITKPVLIDMLDGKVYKFRKNFSGKNSKSDNVFYRLPVRDYPLIITDENALGNRIIKTER